MALNNIDSIVLLTFFAGLQVLGAECGANINIYPEKISDVFPEDVQISCRPDGLENVAREILMLQIYRKGENPMADVHAGVDVIKNKKSSESKYEISGFIDNDISLSNLNVTLLKPGKEWAGIYTCKVYYVNHSGQLVQKTADGELTLSTKDSDIVGTFIKPLIQKISNVENKAIFLEKKATLLEKETTFLKTKTERLESEATLLKTKTASLEAEKNSLEKITKSLQKKISLLESKSKSEENKPPPKKDSYYTSLVEKMAILGYKSDQQFKKMESLEKKDAMLDSKIEEQKTNLMEQMGRISDNTDLSSLKQRIATLETNGKKEKSDRDANKASISSLTKRVGTLEQQEQDQSSQIKSLASKDSTVEASLKKMNDKLTQEVTSRVADRSSLNSFMSKLTVLEKNTEDFSKQITTLKNKESVIENNLQETQKKISQEESSRLSDKAIVTSHIKKYDDLKQKNTDQSKQIEALVKKDDMLASKLGKQYKVLEEQIDGLADKASVSSIGTRVAMLEKTTKEGKSGRDANQASVSSLTKRVGTLEQHGRDHSTQIKSLTDKNSLIEGRLTKTDKDLKQEAASRAADKTSLSSVIRKVSAVEKKSGDNLRTIQALNTKDAAIKKIILDTNNKLSREVSNRLSDKATLNSYLTKVRDLESKSGDQVKQIKSLKDKSLVVDRKLTSIDQVNAKQTRDIKVISDRVTKFVTPGLKTLISLQRSTGRLSSQIKGLQDSGSNMGTRISKLEKLHPKPKRCYNKHCQSH